MILKSLSIQAITSSTLINIFKRTYYAWEINVFINLIIGIDREWIPLLVRYFMLVITSITGRLGLASASEGFSSSTSASGSCFLLSVL